MESVQKTYVVAAKCRPNKARRDRGGTNANFFCMFVFPLQSLRRSSKNMKSSRKAAKPQRFSWHASRLRRETLLCPKRTRYALRAHAPRTRTALARLSVFA